MAEILRQNAEALIDEQVSNEIIEGIVKSSSFMQVARKLPNMTSDVTKLRVLDALPLAYFVGGDTGFKKTTELAWKNKYIHAEEIAVIVPIPESVLDDASYDIWAESKPRIVEAFGKLIDQAIILGTGKPATWREGLLYSINQVGKVVSPVGKDLYAQVSEAMGEVEESGFNPNALLGGVSLKREFRDLRDTTGHPLGFNEISAMPRTYVENGSWDKALAKMIVGDFSQAVFAIRQDITYKVLTEAVIQDPATGDIVYNLAQQDMVALRVVMRLGWEIPNPINALDSGDTRFPFALISGTGAISTVDQKFKVTKADGTTALEGARVEFGGNIGHTDAAGEVTFKAQDGKHYDYSVSLKGYKGQVDDVDASASTINIKLVAKA